MQLYARVDKPHNTEIQEDRTGCLLFACCYVNGVAIKPVVVLYEESECLHRLKNKTDGG